MADPVLTTRRAISVPADALVLLIGAAGSGKSTFARRQFPDEAVVSSDRFRGLLAGDEADQRVTDAAFDLLHQAIAGRLEAGLLTVVDATNLDLLARAIPLDLARRSRRPAVAIVFALPVEVCLVRNRNRPRVVRPAVLRRQSASLRHVRTDLEGEGYAAIHILGSESDVESAVVVYQPPPLPLLLGEGTTGEPPKPARP
jgi:protein phosphatase